MESVRTTLRLDSRVYEKVRSKHREFGFSRVGDLVDAALKDYLRRREDEVKMDAMRRAASDPRYLKIMREISEDFKYVDAENLPPEY